MMISAGANVDAEHSGTGVTPLFTAISQGRLASVARLLAAGADPDHERKDGAVPLHWAAYFGHWKIVEALLESGADVSNENDDGQKPLDLATDPMVREILTRGLDIEFEEDEEDDPDPDPVVVEHHQARHAGGATSLTSSSSREEGGVPTDSGAGYTGSVDESSRWKSGGGRGGGAASDYVGVVGATPRTVDRVGLMLNSFKDESSQDNTLHGGGRGGVGIGGTTDHKVVKAGRRANLPPRPYG